MASIWDIVSLVKVCIQIWKNGSKLALIALAQLLKEHNYNMIDCQFHTDHLESMGGVHISYEEYRKLLPS